MKRLSRVEIVLVSKYRKYLDLGVWGFGDFSGAKIPKIQVGFPSRLRSAIYHILFIMIKKVS